MTTEQPLPTPSPVRDGVPAADTLLTERCADSGQYLAGLIAAAALDRVGRPDRLRELLWPDADPVLVRSVWETALATGYRAGRLAARPEWTVEGLDRLRAALRETGWAGMAGLMDRTAAVHAPRLPGGSGLDLGPGLGPEHARTAELPAAARTGSHP